MARASTVNAPRGTKRTTFAHQRRALAAVGYARRSTDRQEQSIPDQKRAVERYSTEHGLTLLRFYVDDAISGTSSVGRQAFLQLIADAESDRCDFSTIVVYDVKRFGRVDNDEAGYYRHRLRSCGVQVLYTSENFTGDGTDDLLRPVKQWQAREESKDLSKVAIRGLLSKADSAGGWWMGGAPPFGYDLAYESQSGEFLFYLRYLADGSKQMFNDRWKLVRTLERGESVAVSRRDRCKLARSDAQRVKTVERIFEMYVNQQRGFKAIADALNRAGTPTARGPSWTSGYSGQWATTTVRAILCNPAYVGDLVWNRRTDGRFHRIVGGRAVERKGAVGRRLEANAASDWIVITDAHPLIVSRRVWTAAKQLLSTKPASMQQRGINPRTGFHTTDQLPATGWTGPKAKFLLSGLLLCSRCGSRYEGRINYGKRMDAERTQRQRTFVYACGGHICHGKSVCQLGAVPQQMIEVAVVKTVIEFYQPLRDKRERIASLLEQQIGQSARDAARKRQVLGARLRKLEQLTRNLVDSITPVNRVHVDRRLSELDQERQQLEETLNALEAATLAKADAELLIEQTAELAESLATALTLGTQEQRQTIVRQCIESATVDVGQRQTTLTLQRLPTLGCSLGAPMTADVTATWAPEC